LLYLPFFLCLNQSRVRGEAKSLSLN